MLSAKYGTEAIAILSRPGINARGLTKLGPSAKPSAPANHVSDCQACVQPTLQDTYALRLTYLGTCTHHRSGQSSTFPVAGTSSRGISIGHLQRAGLGMSHPLRRSETPPSAHVEQQASEEGIQDSPTIGRAPDYSIDPFELLSLASSPSITTTATATDATTAATTTTNTTTTTITTATTATIPSLSVPILGKPRYVANL